MTKSKDLLGYHIRVSNGRFLPSKFGKTNYLYLHDFMNVLVTIDNKIIATEISAMYGGYIEKTAIGTYRVYHVRGAKKNNTIPEVKGDCVQSRGVYSYD